MPVVRGVKPDAQGRILLEYTVWCREVLQSGPFTLGPPRINIRVGRRRRGFAMYGIAVKPLDKTLMNPELSEEPGGALASTDAS